MWVDILLIASWISYIFNVHNLYFSSNFPYFFKACKSLPCSVLRSFAAVGFRSDGKTRSAKFWYSDSYFTLLVFTFFFSGSASICIITIEVLLLVFVATPRLVRPNFDAAIHILRCWSLLQWFSEVFYYYRQSFAVVLCSDGKTRSAKFDTLIHILRCWFFSFLFSGLASLHVVIVTLINVSVIIILSRSYCHCVRGKFMFV